MVTRTTKRVRSRVEDKIEVVRRQGGPSPARGEDSRVRVNVYYQARRRVGDRGPKNTQKEGVMSNIE